MTERAGRSRVLLAERPRRVLVVVGPSTGGIGAHAAALAADLAALGEQVAVVCPELTAERFAWRVPVETAWPAGSLAERVRAWRRLRALARTADVVHAHGHQGGLLALAAVRGARPRPGVVVSWHNAILVTGPRRWPAALGELVQARRADLVTGASADLAARARRLGARSAELAPVAAPRAGEHVSEPDARARLTRELDLAPHARLVLCVARIAPQKQLDLLVTAAEHLAADPALEAPVTWLVVGDGDPALAAQLREQAARARVDVRLLGARHDVPDLLGAADVLAVPSRWEARPLVIQEAMAAGVPVVATAVGGIPELLGGAGELVAPGAARGFARAVAALLSDPQRHAERSAAGRRRFAELPGREQVTQEWLERYARLDAAGPRLR